MASPVVNTFVIAPDGVAEFSDFDDTVALAAFSTILGQKTRMMAGADKVTLSNVIKGGYDNQVNGNLGGDIFNAVAGSQTRDFVLGGADSDTLDLGGATGGADWLNGNLGNDIIKAGNTSVGANILRGGSGDDVITGSSSNDVLVGDFGKDSLTSSLGQNIFMMRTDDGLVDGVTQRNATQNATDCDVIQDYAGGFDRIAIAGVASFSDLVLTQAGGDVLISCSTFTNGTTGTRFIARVISETVANLQANTVDGKGIIVGDRADAFLAALTPDNFLANADIPL
jgi:Ca2+-binding RTX toxin-like protein